MCGHTSYGISSRASFWPSCPCSCSLQSDIVKALSREIHRGEEEGIKREWSLIVRELIYSGLPGFACLPVIVVCSLSISAPGNYWLVLIGKLLISCSLALFN